MALRFGIPLLACVTAAGVGGVAAAVPPLTRGLDPKHAAAGVERLRAAVSAYLELSEEQLVGMVPTQSGIYFTDCPNCTMAAQDRGNFDWRPQEPQRIVCKDCGAAFPDHPDYPETGVLEVASPLGVHRYPYYERADGYRLYFRAHVDYLAREALAKACENLAELWWATRDDAYARRSAVILLRFAEVYPAYALHYDYPFRAKLFAPPGSGVFPQFEAPRTAKWSWWGYMDLSRELLTAYDALRHWAPLRDLAGGRAVALIESDLLGAMVDYTMGLQETYSNMSPVKWRAAIEAARVLNRPEVVHDAVARIEGFLDGRFLYDASWMETSPSYVQQVLGLLGVIDTALSGYADPPGWRHPRTGRVLSAADTAAWLALRERVAASIDASRFPDGRLIPLNDTWSTSRRQRRERMAAALLPGFGVAVMGGGAGDQQFHAYLNFTSGVHHKQKDALSIGLWAHGKELLSDIGYTHTAYRYWTICTPSHSTVTVDGADQAYDPQHSGNRLRLWASDGAGFHAAEAESVTAYPQVGRYRRTLICSGQEARDAYLVDIFRVHGGSQHDYVLAGTADEDATAESDVPLNPFPGTLLNEGVAFIPPASEGDLNRPQTGLGFIGNLRSAQTDGMVRVDQRLAASPDLGSRSWLDAGPGTTLFLGDAPSIRRSQGRDATLNQYRLPMAVVRRRGADLHSTFVAVHEPVNGSPGIQAVRVERRQDAVILEVVRTDRTEWVVAALDGPAEVSVDTAAGTLAFAGRVGRVQLRDGVVQAAHLVAGSHLRCGGLDVTGGTFPAGRIVGLQTEQREGSRGWFLVAEEIPPAAAGGVLLVRLPDGTVQGYAVAGVERAGQGTRILVRESPGFRFAGESVETLFFPRRTIPGTAATYEVITSAQAQAR